MNDPAVLFYTSDFLTGVMDMTMEERGQYITLLCYQHQKGHIKEETIRLLVGNVSVNVLNHFKIDNEGKYYNNRMDIEKEKRHLFTESRRNNGKKGGRPKKNEEDRKELTDWQEMINFFENKCICCGYQFPENEHPTKDHIIPKTCGGNDDISNLQPLCRECNASKCADNCNDYRLNYIADIPKKLKDKWFIKKPSEKPYGFSKNNHMGNDNDNENINKNDNKDIYSYYESIFGRTLNSIEYETMTKWLEDKTEEQIKKAIDETAMSNIDNIKYVNKVLYSNKKKSKVVPEWFNKEFEESELSEQDDEEFTKFLEEFRK